MRYTKFFCFLFMMVFAASAFSKQPKDKKVWGISGRCFCFVYGLAGVFH